jgi:predicted Rossmann fold flavoprotein
MITVVGGGAAGIFAALAAKKGAPHIPVIVLEKTAVLLSKVKISGGGRCNVTHACFDPKKLIQNYPRGGQELLGPFHRFQPRDTIEWFEERGVKLKTEPDGRIFPVSNSSSTIINCLLDEAKKLGVEIRLRERIDKLPEGKVILATGSSLDGYKLAESLGHTIQPPVPSLFTFNVPSSPLKELSGIATTAKVTLLGSPFTQTGPLLITHFGFSGPAILKLSAWGARFLNEKNYRVEIEIDWLPAGKADLFSLKEQFPRKTLLALNPYLLPKNLWKEFVKELDKPLSHLSKADLQKLDHRLHHDRYLVDGKTTHKEEFVTCGGVLLKEVDFKTMASKIHSGLYFAGEILNIDGITGGFNFQNAWTTGYIAGTSAAHT